MTCLVALPSGGNALLASGSNDKTVHVWGNDVCLLKLQGHTATVTCLAVPSGVGASLASCSKDKTVRIWCNGRCLRILRGHTAAVTCLAVLADRFLVSAGEDGTLRWWKSTSSSCLHTINGVATDVTCVLPSSLPHSLFTVGATSGTLIQVEDGVVLGTTQLQAGLSCLALMPDGKGVCGFRDDRGTLQLWGPDGNTVFTTMHQSSVHPVSIRA